MFNVNDILALEPEQAPIATRTTSTDDSKSTILLSSTFAPSSSSSSSSSSSISSSPLLLVGSNRGTVAMWKLTAKHAISHNVSSSPSLSHPTLTLPNLHNGSIYNIQFIGTQRLCTAGDDGIRIWDWSKLTSTSTSTSPSPSISTSAPTPLAHITHPGLSSRRGATSSHPEVNDVMIRDNIMWAATGDGHVYGHDMSTGQVSCTLRGSRGPVYSIRSLGDRIASVGEDGLVRIWDPRTSQCLHHLDPITGTTISASTAASTSRPWLSCMDVDARGDWLVCGGGSRYLSLWHLSTGLVTVTLPTASTPQVCAYAADGNNIISMGNEPYVYHWTSAGKLETKIKTTVNSIFSMATYEEEQGREKKQSLAICGSSPSVDIFLNPLVLSYSLQFQ